MENTMTARRERGRRIAAPALLVVSLAAPAALAQPAGPAVLRPGIVIDTARREAYVMTPRGIDAIDVATGAVKWSSTAADKPLALVGDLLVAQAQPTALGRLELVSLDVTKGGEARARQGAALPAGVQAAIGETLQGTFTIEARPAPAAAALYWRFVPESRQGMPDPDEATPGTRDAAAKARLQAREGALRFDPATGAVRRLDTARPPQPRAWSLAPSQKMAKAGAARQFESADGRHVLASERTGDDLTWDKYRWTVFERATQRQVGEMRTHVSFAPFVVVDSTLIYETTPYVRGQEKEEPAKLRAVDLTNGAPRWAVEVREITFRGPFPP